MQRITTTLFLIVSIFSLHAQEIRVEPPNWWIGMQNDTVQLLVHAEGAGKWQPSVKAKGVTLLQTHTATSPNYLFLDLKITPEAKPGSIKIKFSENGKTVATHAYPISQRSPEFAQVEGFQAKDVMYLITPDRFANGDTTNDSVEGLREKGTDRSEDYARHGGDLRGIINHLDYIADMGFTTIWPNPMLENDMPKSSYHGYAITDYYKVDPRYGTLEEYQELAEKGRAKGIKLIMDGVVNHCGSKHWWMEDLPFEDWLNYQEKIQVTNHKRTVNQDLYAAEVDKQRMTGGWFVPQMPDLNQRNPFMATYLIQNSIWWIEMLGLAGIRQDTYPYPDKYFLSNWTCRIMQEYPNFSITGEEWSYNPVIVAYWQQGHDNPDGYTSCLKSPMDFPMQGTLSKALVEPENWNSGLIKLYEALANDFIYTNPNDLLTFADNHDMDRIFTQVKDDPALAKMAMAYLLTVRGIPQVYYGTEVLMGNSAKPGDHGLIRTDFPGGWPGDTQNAFTGKALSQQQKDMQAYVKALLNWRKTEPAIYEGKTLHFAPVKGVYVYLRYTETSRILVVMNKNKEEVDVPLSHYQEAIQGAKTGTDVLWKETVELGETLKVPPVSTRIMNLGE
ncbi:MAG: glycoside hydrolase family 13 protein [Bacteroidota bacterium]